MEHRFRLFPSMEMSGKCAPSLTLTLSKVSLRVLQTHEFLPAGYCLLVSPTKLRWTGRFQWSCGFKFLFRDTYYVMNVGHSSGKQAADWVDFHLDRLSRSGKFTWHHSAHTSNLIEFKCHQTPCEVYPLSKTALEVLLGTRIDWKKR